MEPAADNAASAPVRGPALLVRELQTMRMPAWTGLGALSLTCIIIWAAFRDTADVGWIADMWMAITLLLHATLLLLLRRFMRAGPKDSGSLDRWVRAFEIIRLAMTVMMAAVPWVLMGGAPEAAQMLGIAMIPWYLGISVLFTSTAYPIPAAELSLVAVSGAIFAVVQGLPYGWGWAFLMLAAGGSMVALRAQALESVTAAIARGLAVEAAAAETRLALAVADAERDAKARFVASASHDLKQPLATARIWAHLALEAQPGHARTEALAKAEQAFSAAADLVDSMLDHLRLEADSGVARIAAVSIGPILLATAARHAPAAEDVGLRIRAVPSRLGVAADPELLARALDNLVANSIRHSGGRRLLLGARREGAGVAIWAIDDGRGVAPVDRARLFEAYVQGALAGPGGFGIGLSSARRQLELMHGHAVFDPNWTNGAAFRLWLPAAERQCAPLAA